MVEKKSIIEEALLDIKNIQNTLNANTKEILRSVAVEEINGVVKGTLKEEAYDEEDLDTTDNLDVNADAATDDIEVSDLNSEKDNLSDTQVSTDEVTPEFGSETGMDADALDTVDMDMTQASDDDVIAIYKKLSGEDEIEIVGDEIHLNVTEPGEYIVKTGGLTDNPEMGVSDNDNPEMDDDNDDVEYEIEMDDDDSTEEPSDLVPVEDETEGTDDEIENEEGTEEPIEEKISVGIGMSQGTHRNPKTGGSIGAAENPKSKLDESKKLVFETKKYNILLTEAKKLKAENEEFRKALKEFRTKLVETVVFNSNLTYVTKLFTEHTTTKKEKENIIKRFDEEVSNLKESKKLYKTIANELTGRKPISESIENKIIKENTSSSSKQLNESTVYVDESTKRILDLMKRVEQK